MTDSIDRKPRYFENGVEVAPFPLPPDDGHRAHEEALQERWERDAEQRGAMMDEPMGEWER